jgi:lysyl-tRNA synthetase class 1
VTIEPGGKDLSTAGGSRDRSDAIAREVFEREPPLNVPYEFLNIGGKKMSTSKGQGAAAHTIAEVIPPEQLRFLFLRPRPNQAIEFDPDGTDAVPRLFDEFDKFAAATAGRQIKGEIAPGYEATFRYSLLDPNADVQATAALFRPAFAHLALLEQIPGVDVAARVETEKGTQLTEPEVAILRERVAAAHAWLETYAPESARIAIQDELPGAAAEMTDDMRRYLRAVAIAAETLPEYPDGAQWQNLLFDAAVGLGMRTNRDSFAAIYRAFIGRDSGPRAGWLLASLDKDFVVRRLLEAADATPVTNGAPS